MNSYTIDTVLETREPGVIELFGGAAGVVHKVAGVLHLHVDKTIHLKELSVVFLCEAVIDYTATYVSTSSEPMTKYKNQFDAIPTSSAPTEFLPGAYTFPFQIAIPSDLSTTDSTKLIFQQFSWKYHLTTTAVPGSTAKGTVLTSLFQKRKTIQQALTLRNVVDDPFGGNSIRCSNAGRKGESEKDGEFRVVIFVPKIVNVKQTIVPVTVQLQAIGGRGRNEKKGKFWVKEIQAQAMQTEKIMYSSSEAYRSMKGIRSMISETTLHDPTDTEKYKNPAKLPQQQALQCDFHNQSAFSSSSAPTPMIKSTHTKVISNLVTIPNPNQYLEGIHTSPEDYSQTFELHLTAAGRNGKGGKEVLASESLSWAQISHAVRLQVVFEDEVGQQPLIVKAPLTIAFVCPTESSLASGRPMIEAQVERERGAVESNPWMVAESAPMYEFGTGDVQGGQGREEDALPEYVK
ncbi:hypothetical protein BGX24_000919 [Mortierella sp. AD032]|nr:hypothetical protein BGX24_000919 [Mortierella sp. AD032]